MNRRRRTLLVTGAATVAAAWPFANRVASFQGAQMYGLIGKMTTAAGKRDEVLAILLDGINNMPGCLSYIVAKDPKDDNALWITEVWDSDASHKASLSLPEVKAAITKARPLIAGFSDMVNTIPVGGHGLAPATR
jgi:quinol monooxygenase YgiN